MSSEFQIGQYDLIGESVRSPAPGPAGPSATTAHQASSDAGRAGATDRVPTARRMTRAHQRTDGAGLPDWMRNPPADRTTISDRLARLPGGAAVRRRWWAWQDRRRLHERFPVAFKIVAFFLSWIFATILVVFAYGFFS